MQGQVALVTGVSNAKGIGIAICKELAREGFDVFFTYWNNAPTEKSSLQSLIDSLKSIATRADFILCDLSKRGVAKAIFDKCEASMGKVSVLVNNAAHSAHTPLSFLTEDQLEEHFRINTIAPAMLIKEFLSRYDGGHPGRIINITSGQALGPMPGEIAYTISKAGLDTLTQQLALQIASKGVTINSINPGPTDTGWMNSDLKISLAARFPSGQINGPEKVAKIVAFLAGTESSPITGQIINAESGFNRFTGCQ